MEEGAANENAVPVLAADCPILVTPIALVHQQAMVTQRLDRTGKIRQRPLLANQLCALFDMEGTSCQFIMDRSHFLEHMENTPMTPNKKPNILFGLTGSPASSRAPEILAELQRLGNVAVVLTDRAQHFVDCQELEKAAGPCTVPNDAGRKFNYFNDSDEWNWARVERDGTPYFSAKWQKGDLILHEQLQQWVNIVLIAPTSQDMLARMDTGLCDDLLTLVVNGTGYPCAIAPASPWFPNMSNRLRELYRRRRIHCVHASEDGMASTEDILKTVKLFLSEIPEDGR